MITQLAAAFAALSLWPGAYAMRPVFEPSNNTADSNATTDPMAACKLYAHMNVHLSSGWEPLFDCVPSTGTIHGFMIFVDFPDANATGTAPQAVYESLMPQADDWFQTSSYGQLSLNITADISKFHRMTAPTTSYGWSSMTTEAHTMYIQDALDAYLQAHDADTKPFPEADVLYIVASPSAQAFFNSMTASFRPTTRSGQVVAQKVVTLGMDVHQTDGYKTLNHETGHTMCLADYYPTDHENPLGHYVAGFSLMADERQQAPDHFAWDKWRMGWLPDTAVDCVSEKGSTTHVLSPLEKRPEQGTQTVVMAVSGYRALIAEVRTKSGVDDKLCSEGSGVLLYTVDTEVPSGQGPLRVLNNAPTRWTCSGYPANRAALSFDEGRSSSLTMEEFGVTVTLTVQEGNDRFTIKVDYV